MIRRLTLKNWRNYEDISLEFGSGTTFIVAPNGIGKTSLMEAAVWAVFGDLGQRPNDAVRIGASSATATAEVELPDHRVARFSRTLLKRPGTRLPQAIISIDGVETDEPRALGELRRCYAAEPAFLLRLIMPSGHSHADSPSDFGLRGHLSRIFGIDGLLNALADLEQRIKAQEKLIKAAKLCSPADAAAISALRRRVMVAEATAAEADSAHQRANRTVDQARETERFREQLNQWQRRAAAYSHELAGLAETAGPDVPLDLRDPDLAQRALDTALSSVQAELEALRVRQALLRGQATVIGQHAQKLQSAHGDCPVCRRPLDAESIGHAKSAHSAELASIGQEIEQLRMDEALAVAKHQHVRMVIEQFRGLQHPGPQPEPEATANSDPGASLEMLEAERQQFLSALVDHRSELARAHEDLETALADEAAHTRLRKLYAEEAVLRASHSAISATTTQLLDTTIDPLATELSARWRRMFPGRGQLRTQSNGDVRRELNGESLPYSAFSTGERAGLVILLRLLVLEASTNANFCWFDEPLEHLAPEARRHVAEVLSRASNTGRLGQIVVSTYEEPLARRLQERDPDNVKLIYVRQNPN